MILYGMYYLFGPFGSPALSVSPSNFLYTPSLLAGSTAQEAEKSLDICKHCSAATKNIGVLSPLKNPKHSNVWASTKKINSIPAKTLTITNVLLLK